MSLGWRVIPGYCRIGLAYIGARRKKVGERRGKGWKRGRRGEMDEEGWTKRREGWRRGRGWRGREVDG